MNVVNSQDSLYHFTSLESVQSIISSGKLRLTSCNNAKNFKVEVEALRSVLNEHLGNNEEAIKKFFKEYDLEDKDELIARMLQERESTYISCFVRLEGKEEITDEKYSLLWANYANDFKGVAIEFDERYFPPDRGVATSNSGRESQFGLFKMEYDNNVFIGGINNTSINSTTNSLYLDRYKPECCKNEHETRFIIYKKSDLHRRCHHEISRNDIRRVSENDDCLEYDIVNKDGGALAITKIYCRTEEIKNKLAGVFDENKIQLVK